MSRPRVFVPICWAAKVSCSPIPQQLEILLFSSDLLKPALLSRCPWHWLPCCVPPLWVCLVHEKGCSPAGWPLLPCPNSYFAGFSGELCIIPFLLYMEKKISWRFSLLTVTHCCFSFLCGQLGKTLPVLSLSLQETGPQVHALEQTGMCRFIFLIAFTVIEITLDTSQMSVTGAIIYI